MHAVSGLPPLELQSRKDFYTPVPFRLLRPLKRRIFAPSRVSLVGRIFLKSVCVAALMVSSFNARAQDSRAETNAQSFVELLGKGDFAAAKDRFDATMKSALPEEKLREVWRSLEGQAGAFKKQTATRITKQLGYDVVLVTCQFEKAMLDVKVVFAADGLVAGLFFVPSQVVAYVAPAYVKTNLFKEREVRFGLTGWRLPGTLALPVNVRAPCPAVILVHGSGPEDRDETIGPNKPFRDLAWGLASKGVAVLRYEKRTKEYGAKFVNDFTITLKEETVEDAVQAVRLLREMPEINPDGVFVLGHSLGGLAAPRIAAAEPRIRGLVVLAGSTRPLEDLVLEQTKYVLAPDGKLSVEGEAKLQQLKLEVEQIKALQPKDASAPGLLIGAPRAYWLDLRRYDPIATAKKLSQPMLILQGGRDYQVTEGDFVGWKKGLNADPRVTFKFYPDLNHLFVTGRGKSTPAEYEKAGHVAEVVVNDIGAWVLGQVSRD